MLKKRSIIALILVLAAVVASVPTAGIAVSADEGAPGIKTLTVYDESLIETKHDSYDKYKYDPDFTITLNDGTVLYSSAGDYYKSIYYNGRTLYLSFTDDQSYEKPWDLGKHTVTAELEGIKTDFTVEIIKSSYVSLEILKVYPVYENKDVYVNNDGKIIYNLPDFLYKVTREDGSSFVRSYSDDAFSPRNETSIIISRSSNQEESPWTVGGNNIITASFYNLTASAKVDIIPTPAFDTIEQNGGLFITDCRVFTDTVEIPSQIDGKNVIGILSLGKASDLIKNLIIPDSVVTIGNNALAKNLESVVIGSGVNYIDIEQFVLCKNLKKITVSGDNPYYCDIDGVVFNKQRDTVVVYPLGKGDEYTIPASVKNIDALQLEIYSKLNLQFEDSSTEFKTIEGITYTSDLKKVISCNKNKSGEYIMPDSVTEISERAFAGCTKLTNVKISPNVTSIVYELFYGCAGLTSVTIPDSVKTIEKYAFAGCEELKDVNISSLASWCEIEFGESYGYSNPLSYAENLYVNGVKTSEIVIPNTVKSIPNYAFYHFDGITSVTVSDSVEKIGKDAFYSCKALTSVSIPASVKNIGEFAFYSCNFLKDVYISDIASWCDIEFENDSSNPLYCAENLYVNGVKTSEIVIPGNVKSIPNYAFYLFDGITSVTVSDGVEKIGESAFFSCKAITSVSIPASVKNIGDRAFCSCNSLKDVYISDIASWCDIEFGGYYSNPLSNAENLYVNGVKMSEIVIPGNVKSIPNYAFDHFDGITSVIISDGVEKIGYYAFDSCGSLENISIGNGVSEIPEGAFEGTAVKSIVIPVNVKHICEGAFAGCRLLADVVFENGEIQIDDRAFYNCPLKELNLKYGITKIAAYSFEGDDISTLKLPDSVTEIAYRAFYNCKNLSEIDIPESVVSLTKYAFHDTIWYESQPFGEVYLEHVLYDFKGDMEEQYEMTVKPGTTVIADYALYKDTGLSKITFPEGLKTIGAFSLFGCYNLTEINIPASVSSIGQNAFAMCTSLTSIRVDPANPYYKVVDGVLFSKDGTELIYCLRRNSSEYTVPASVKNIRLDAFSDSGVTTLTISGKNTALEDSAVGLYPAVGYKCYRSYDHINHYGRYTELAFKMICPIGSLAAEYAEKYNIPYTGVPYEVKVGDADGNGNVNSNDAIFMLRSLTGWFEIEDISAVDINGDNDFDSNDVIMFLRILAGWEF